jgi:hypothetical protein
MFGKQKRFLGVQLGTDAVRIVLAEKIKTLDIKELITLNRPASFQSVIELKNRLGRAFKRSPAAVALDTACLQTTPFKAPNHFSHEAILLQTKQLAHKHFKQPESLLLDYEIINQSDDTQYGNVLGVQKSAIRELLNNVGRFAKPTIIEPEHIALKRLLKSTLKPGKNALLLHSDGEHLCTLFANHKQTLIFRKTAICRYSTALQNQAVALLQELEQTYFQYPVSHVVLSGALADTSASFDWLDPISAPRRFINDIIPIKQQLEYSLAAMMTLGFGHA